jgi:hypothetical protein
MSSRRAVGRAPAQRGRYRVDGAAVQDPHRAASGRRGRPRRASARPPPDAWIDVEAALEAGHWAESASALVRWRDAWGAALVARFVGTRRCLARHEAPWIDARRRAGWPRSCCAPWRPTPPPASGGRDRAGRRRADRSRADRAAPYQESGYRLLMEVKAARGNVAEALQIYQQLRRTCARSSAWHWDPRPSRSTCGCSSSPMTNIATSSNRHTDRHARVQPVGAVASTREPSGKA